MPSPPRRRAEGARAGPIRVRIGVYTGEPLVTEEGYVGIDVHQQRGSRPPRMGARSSSPGRRAASSRRALPSATSASTAEGLDWRRTPLSTRRGRLPPLRTLDATICPSSGSRSSAASVELEQLVALLSDGTRSSPSPCPGGTGKTRLALQVAAELVGNLPDEVFWMLARGPTDPELLRRSLPNDRAPDDLTGFLRGRALLLLLDNSEHLLDAAPAVSDVLAPAPGSGSSSEPGAASCSGRAGIPARPASREAGRRALCRARSGVGARGRSRRDGGRDLPPPRRLRSPSSWRQRGRSCLRPSGFSSGSTRRLPS